MNGWRLVVTLGALACAAFAAVVATHGTDEAGLRVLVRVTARIAFALFLVVYTAAALRRLFPNDATRWLRRNRRYLGVSFFVALMLHLVGIGLLSVLLGDAFRTATSTLLVGGLAYAFAAAMALTSTDRTAAWLGPRRWGLLHRVGLHWLWGVFALTMLLDAFARPAYFAPLLLAVAALGLRLAAARSRTTRDRALPDAPLPDPSA